MEQSLFTRLFLPAALGIIMFCMGLSLTIADFNRVLKYPRAIAVALVCQMVLLPLLCFFLVKISGLDPALAVGMMLLAASPGGAVSNLYSHLAKGDVALNVSLTAINSVLSLFLLPAIVNFSLNHFMNKGQFIPMQFEKVVEVFIIVLVPVTLGMMIKKIRPRVADSIFKPLRIASILFLLLIIVSLVIKERQILADNFSSLGLPLLVFSAMCLATGYFIPRLFKIEKKQSISISMEVGIHNGTLAIYVALTVLQNETMSVPPAISSLLILFMAAIFGYWLRKRAN